MPEFSLSNMGVCVLCPGTLLCVCGIVIAVIVSILDEIGTRHLSEGSIQEESRKMVIYIYMCVRVRVPASKQ